jgi:hypothetical protein
MGTNNTVVWSMSGGSLTHNYLFRNGRDDQGAAYGYATATFEVIGASPVINFGSYKSAQNSTLKSTVDANGLATINVSDTATFGVGSTLNIDLKDCYLPRSGQTYTVLTAAGGITNNGLALALEDTVDWSFDVSSNSLTIEYTDQGPQPNSDLNDDCSHDFLDFAYIAWNWLEDTRPLGSGICGDKNHPVPSGDTNWDCIVDCNDIDVLAQNWLTPIINAVRVDSLDRIYPDIEPNTITYTSPISVPKGGSVPFQYSFKACRDGLCSISIIPAKRTDGVPLGEQAKIHRIVPVHVEANSQGDTTYPYPAQPPASWMELVVREAPFDVAEALFEVNEVNLVANENTGVLVDVKVPVDAQTGVYTGYLRLSMDSRVLDMPFSLEVHKAVITDYVLDSTYRLSFLPEDLTYNRTPPAWWSEEYWDLAEAAGRAFKEAGLNIMLTPLVSGFKGDMPQNPLISTRIDTSGNYVFDFSNFVRWGDLFINQLGFDKLEGWQIGRREEAIPYDVYAYDERISQTVLIFDYQSSLPVVDMNDFYNYIGEFFSAFYSVLVSNGWTSNYIQEIADEPHADHEQTYAAYKQLLTDNMPGIPNLDALWSEPDLYSPYIDIEAISITVLAQKEYLVNQRNASGLTTWFYSFGKPYPPYPNTWLDRSLSCSRLYPWLAYHLFDVKGYLFWAPNRYRGADPYLTSIGPTSGGSQNPGGSVGSCWTFYPTPDGLVLSMRMIAYREGLLDHTLLKMLAEHDQSQADAIMDSIATSLTSYEENPDAYHQGRRNLLLALDNIL